MASAAVCSPNSAFSPRGSAVLAPRYQARRTNALPKQTLFGSSIEPKTNRECLEQLKENNALYKNVYKQHEKSHVNGLAIGKAGTCSMEALKTSYGQAKKFACEELQKLNTTKEKRLFFSPLSAKNSKDKQGTNREALWYTDKDIQNSAILNENNNNKWSTFSRGSKIFNSTLNTPKIGQRYATVKRPFSADSANLHKDLLALNRNNNSKDDEKQKYCQCYKPQSTCTYENCFTCNRPKLDLSVFTKNMTKDYEDLSNLLRANVVPGYTIHHYKGLMNTIHCDEVFLKRDAPTDQFRARKDAYSVWAEANLVREKLIRKWKAAEEEKKNKKQH